MIAFASWPNPAIIVPDLQRYGADANARNARGETALIKAYRWNGVGPKMVAQLLKYGAAASLRDAKGETALSCAMAHQADPETIRLLRQAGARK